MGTQLQELAAAGQSIWLDNIRRSMFASGELARLIGLGLRGMTSNPTIFEKAIGGASDYDEQLRELLDRRDDPNAVFEALAIDDIRHALDLFRPLYDQTSGGDGYVSLEVSPLLAHDTAGTVAAAKRLWAAVDRPNVMIKIPATPAGIPAITEAIAAGINVNVTLIFAIETYTSAAKAYIDGLERRAAAGQPIDRVASVASVFISRIDTAVDGLLQEHIAKGEPLGAYVGKTGLANVRLTYQRFRSHFGDERFAALRAKGARPQRPLWASTGTKNPAYSDLLYVENLVGEETVNTVPPATLDALLDHGKVRPNSVTEGLEDARALIGALRAANISLFDVMARLQEEGVKSFAGSYRAMLEAISAKQAALARNGKHAVEIDLGNASVDPDAAVAALARDGFLQKLWTLDPSPWSTDPDHAEIVKHALGWLTFPERVAGHAGDLQALAATLARRFEHVVVLGMGGSSLAPDVLRATFGHTPGFPQLHVLDSSDPNQVRSLEAALDLERSIFIVASKSGTTTEPEAFFRYFYGRVAKSVGARNAGSHFIAITDPDTQLACEAAAADFHRVFVNDPNIGGRYSALSYFGMVPAALAGYDVATILDRGIGALHANARTTAVEAAEGVRFGATIAALAKSGRDKLTIVAHPFVSSFGAWAEQLIAESTGKLGRGIVPIDGEPLGAPDVYGDDRVFVYVGSDLDEVPAIEQCLAALAAAGHPIIRLRMRDRLDIGAQFALWEIATATAGAVLGIDAFDQPNVQESKDNTKRLLAEFAKSGRFAEPDRALATPAVDVFALAGSRAQSLGTTLVSALDAIFAQVAHGDYVAITAYVEMNAAHVGVLERLRLRVRDALRVATTVGFGPRFLHSTGQLHKGGPPTGVFLQLTADPSIDLPIPGMTGFATLERAQALGDFESLDSRGRRGARLHLLGDVDAALAQLDAAVADALAVVSR